MSRPEMDWPEVKAWRRGARTKMLAARAALSTAVRQDLSQRLAARLKPVLSGRPQPISLYWPIKAEPDLRPLMRALDAEGIAVCLPVAVKLGEPLRFRPWRKGCQMERGFWDIPVPATTEEVEPHTLIAPIVGYDGEGYRLGYGGGFFDRTLASLPKRPVVIGVTYEMARLETIYPQDWDIPMDYVVTERGVYRRDPDGLAFLGAPEPSGSGELASPVCYADEKYFGGKS